MNIPQFSPSKFPSKPVRVFRFSASVFLVDRKFRGRRFARCLGFYRRNIDARRDRLRRQRIARPVSRRFRCLRIDRRRLLQISRRLFHDMK